MISIRSIESLMENEEDTNSKENSNISDAEDGPSSGDGEATSSSKARLRMASCLLCNIGFYLPDSDWNKDVGLKELIVNLSTHLKIPSSVINAEYTSERFPICSNGCQKLVMKLWKLAKKGGNVSNIIQATLGLIEQKVVDFWKMPAYEGERYKWFRKLIIEGRRRRKQIQHKKNLEGEADLLAQTGDSEEQIEPSLNKSDSNLNVDVGEMSKDSDTENSDENQEKIRENSDNEDSDENQVKMSVHSKLKDLLLYVQKICEDSDTENSDENEVEMSEDSVSEDSVFCGESEIADPNTGNDEDETESVCPVVKGNRIPDVQQNKTCDIDENTMKTGANRQKCHLPSNFSRENYKERKASLLAQQKLFALTRPSLSSKKTKKQKSSGPSQVAPHFQSNGVPRGSSKKAVGRPSKSFKCTVCRQGFAKNLYLHNHKRIHGNNQETLSQQSKMEIGTHQNVGQAPVAGGSGSPSQQRLVDGATQTIQTSEPIRTNTGEALSAPSNVGDTAD